MVDLIDKMEEEDIPCVFKKNLPKFNSESMNPK
jgi:hypothetical protein